MSAWDELLAYANGEEIEAVVIGYWDSYPLPIPLKITPDEVLRTPLAPEDARQFMQSWCLETEYDGAASSPLSKGLNGAYDITAWTTTRVVFLWEYDGSHKLTSLPRNPAPVQSGMPKGEVDEGAC